MICISVLGQSVENHQPVIQVSRVRVMNKEIPTFQIGAGSGRGHELQKSFDGKSWELIRLVPRTAKPSYWFDTNNLSTVTLYQLVENPAEVILAHDVFQQTNSEVGVLPHPQIGAPWEIYGIGWNAGSKTRVLNGAIVDENPQRAVTYLGQRFSEKPNRMEMDVTWEMAGSEGFNDTCFTMALCRQTSGPWFTDCLHIRFYSHSVAIDVFEGGWFTLNMAVSIFDQPLNLGMSHNLGFDSVGDKVRVWINGIKVLEASDPAFDRNSGPYAFWEIYSESGPLRTSGKIQSMTAYSLRSKASGTD